MELHVNVQTLIDLGLNRSEARVYNTLYEIGTAKATTISKASRVPRPDVYRTLSKLSELGLVEKLISYPLRFRPVPIETGVAILLELKSKKYNELKSKSTSLIHSLNKKNSHKNFYQESQFVLIPSTEVLIKRLTKTIKKTQTSIDVSTSWKRFKVASYRLAESLEKAWCRGVKGRLVMEKT
jgi:sugar-specific transcriptional regulator TrmB